MNIFHTSGCISFIFRMVLTRSVLTNIHFCILKLLPHNTEARGCGYGGEKKQKKHLTGRWGQSALASFVVAMNKMPLLKIVLHSATVSAPAKPATPSPQSYSSIKQPTGGSMSSQISNRHFTLTRSVIIRPSWAVPLRLYCTSSHWLRVWACLFSS